MTKRTLQVEVVTIQGNRHESKIVNFMHYSDAIWLRNHIIWAISNSREVLLRSADSIAKF